MAPFILNPHRFGSGGTTYSSEVLADSPLGYWRQGDPSGTAMTDSSGNARGGTYSGTVTLGAGSLLTGDADTSADFGGGRSTVSNAAWMNTTTVVIEAVIRPDTVPGAGNYAFIASRENNGTTGPFWFVLHSGKLEFACWTGGSSSPTELMGATTLSAATTYHVAGYYDGTDMKVYIDGTEDGTVGKTGNLNSNAQDLILGNWSAANLPFDGRIDEVALYDSLTPARIAAHAALV